MSQSLTALTDRQIAAEEALRYAGYHAEAHQCRTYWNGVPSDGLGKLVEELERMAADALADPRRFVIPAGEPVALAEAARAAASYALLSDAVIAACGDSRRRATKGGEQR
jgi:hypothetical protein